MIFPSNKHTMLELLKDYYDKLNECVEKINSYSDYTTEVKNDLLLLIEHTQTSLLEQMEIINNTLSDSIDNNHNELLTLIHSVQTEISNLLTLVNDNKNYLIEEINTVNDNLLNSIHTLENSINTLSVNKVDKVNGKGLSSNDYTTTDKQTLNNVNTFIANIGGDEHLFRNRGALGNGIDLNKILACGSYQITPGTLNNDGVGYGVLTVYKSGGYIVQRLKNLGASYETHERSSGDGGISWHAWTKNGQSIVSKLSSSIYKEMGDGVILQTGNVIGGVNGGGTNKSVSFTMNFPKAFPNKVVSIVATCTHVDGNEAISQIVNVGASANLSQANITLLRVDGGVWGASGVGICWTAYGY